jgi:hypothetical protein
MPKLDEYRTMADECLRSAREAQTKEERLLYLNLARVWLESHRVKMLKLPLLVCRQRRV